MALDLQYDLANYTPADSTPVEANFNRTQQYINTELINRGGTVAMSAPLQLVGDPISALDAAPKSYVDTFVPVGAMLMFGGAAAPPGGKWAICNGAELEQALYPALFAAIGQTFGGTSGHFNLPNLVGRFPIGAGSADAIGTSSGSRDQAVISHTHPLDHSHPTANTGTDSPEHAHTVPNHLHGVSIETGGMDTYPGYGTNGQVHSHYMRGIGTTSQAGGVGEGNVADISNGAFAPAFNTNTFDAQHTHAVNGTTQGSGDFGTTGASARHAHNYTVPAYVGASGTPAGAVSPTNANLPPYLSINYIIRVA